MLQQIEGQQGLLRDVRTSAVINLRDYVALDRTYEFNRYVSNLQTRPGESWILERWSILIHPWPEVIHPDLQVELVLGDMGDMRVARVPVFAVAEPLARTEDEELRNRVAAIEEKLGIEPSKPKAGGLAREYVSSSMPVRATLYGKADDIMLLREYAKIFRLRLQGLVRGAA